MSKVKNIQHSLIEDAQYGIKLCDMLRTLCENIKPAISPNTSKVSEKKNNLITN